MCQFLTAMENTDYLEVTPRSQVPVSVPRSATGWQTSGKHNRLNIWHEQKLKKILVRF